MKYIKYIGNNTGLLTVHGHTGGHIAPLIDKHAVKRLNDASLIHLVYHFG